jgi:hypothetical protein
VWSCVALVVRGEWQSSCTQTSTFYKNMVHLWRTLEKINACPGARPPVEQSSRELLAAAAVGDGGSRQSWKARDQITRKKTQPKARCSADSCPCEQRRQTLPCCNPWRSRRSAVGRCLHFKGAHALIPDKLHARQSAQGR